MFSQRRSPFGGPWALDSSISGVSDSKDATGPITATCCSSRGLSRKPLPTSPAKEGAAHLCAEPPARFQAWERPPGPPRDSPRDSVLGNTVGAGSSPLHCQAGPRRAPSSAGETSNREMDRATWKNVREKHRERLRNRFYFEFTKTERSLLAVGMSEESG